MLQKNYVNVVNKVHEWFTMVLYLRTWIHFIINTISPGRCGSNFKTITSEQMLRAKFLCRHTWANVDSDLCCHMASPYDLYHNAGKIVWP